ncbi:MAG: hypothetical protein HN356_04030 [Calditrichaeota bacterium]|jgi:hypothetical protein|nr:hypothetical protein [Calditrichota bacterium]MBT7617391.1 hypothetical protein [Calditrichota bacterium]
MKSIFYPIILVLCLGITSLSFSQENEGQAENQEDAVNEGGVLMLQEILIEVAPELPTVVVTIQRQKPEIEKVAIKSPLKRMQLEESTLIRPDLSKMKPTKIKEPKKMLARERKR